MSKTLIVFGLPSNINLSEIAANLDKLFDTDDIGTFRIRKLHFNRLALDFQNSYDAFSAQAILNGFYYTLSHCEPCHLKAKINTDARLECLKEPPGWESYLPSLPDEGNVVKVEPCSDDSKSKRKRSRKRRIESDQNFKTENSDDSKTLPYTPESKCPLKSSNREKLLTRPTYTKLPQSPDSGRKRRTSSPDRPSVSLKHQLPANHQGDGPYKRSKRRDIKTEVISDEENETLGVSILDALTPVLAKVMDHFRRQCRVVLDTRYERVAPKETDRERVIRRYLKVVAERLKALKLNRFMMESDIVSEYKLRHPLKMDLALIKKLVDEEVIIELEDSDEEGKEPPDAADDIWAIVDEVLNTADKLDVIEDEMLKEIKEEPESESYREPSPNITKINITIKVEPSKSA